MCALKRQSFEMKLWEAIEGRQEILNFFYFNLHEPGISSIRIKERIEIKSFDGNYLEKLLFRARTGAKRTCGRIKIDAKGQQITFTQNFFSFIKLIDIDHHESAFSWVKVFFLSRFEHFRQAACISFLSLSHSSPQQETG